MDQMAHKIAKRAADLRSPKFGQIAEVRGLASGRENVVDLGYGEPNFHTPAHIREAAKRAIDDGYTHYVLPVEGLTPLREAIAEKLSRENGMDVDPSAEVLVIAGVQEGINVVLLTLINPGDEVILPEPYYYSDPLGVLLAGGVPVYTKLEESRDFRITVPGALNSFLVEKGSIAVDGVSLTVTSVKPGEFGVSVIPHTLSTTTLGENRTGDTVNIETDVLAKYLEKFSQPRKGVTDETLRSLGYS